MSRVRDIANILSGGSSAIATDAEVAIVSSQIPANVAGKNLVINGGFDIWQRGTSFVSPNAVYTTDRWSNDTAGMTISRQSSGAPSGSLYYIRTTSTSSSAYTDFYYFFETANVSTLLGKTVTYSFKVRKSGTTPIGSFILTLQKSASVDGGRSSTWTTIVSASTAFSNILTGTSSSDWTTVTATATIPNDGSANSLRFIGGFDNGQASGVVVDLAQVQLEIGSTVTTFSRAGGTIQGELSACQRYYWRIQNVGVYTHMGFGAATNTASAGIFIKTPVTMRTSPSSVEFSTLAIQDVFQTLYAVAGINIDQTGADVIGIVATVSGTPLTQYRPMRMVSNASTSGYLGFSAEL